MTVYVIDGDHLDKLADLIAEKILLGQPKPKQTEWMNINEAAEYLSLPVGGIYYRVSRREIPFHRVGRRNMFDRAELDDWMRG